MKSNKAQAATISILVMIAILVVAFYSQQHPIELSEKIGDRQNAILSAYTEAEAAREFIKLSAQDSAQQAIFDQASLGGFQKSSCNESYLSCSLMLNNRQLKNFNCYETSKKDDSLCRTYSLDYKTCPDSCTRKQQHIFFCAYLDQNYVCPCTKGTVTKSCDEVPDDDLKNWNSGECVITLNTKKSICTIYSKDATEISTLVCDESNNFCKNYGLESCKLEGCDFVRELDVKCELKTESKTCSKSSCGMLNDSYAIWLESEKECFPTQENMINAFLSDFESNFENYLSGYNLTDAETLHSALKYDFEVKETANGFDILGSPQDQEIKIFNIDTLQVEQKILESKLTIENDAYSFKYSVEPCFKISVNYLLYNYEDVAAKVKECISQGNCLSLDGTSVYGFEWSVSSSNGYLLFDLKPTSQEKFLVFSSNKIGEFLPELKFAIRELA